MDNASDYRAVRPEFGFCLDRGIKKPEQRWRCTYVSIGKCSELKTTGRGLPTELT